MVGFWIDLEMRANRVSRYVGRCLLTHVRTGGVSGLYEPRLSQLQGTGMYLRVFTQKAELFLAYVTDLFRGSTSFGMAGSKYLKHVGKPWLVWLSGLSAGLRTERSPVQFPVRAHAWVVGRVPSWGHVRGNRLMFLSHINVSLSFSL